MKTPLQSFLATLGQRATPGQPLPDVPAPWLEPIDAEHPSGPPLDYDPEYAVLAARLTPKTEVQYGHFKAGAAEPDFKDIERDCRRLLLRSKDLNLLIWFARSRTRQAGAQGLWQGLSALQQVCEHFGASVHPQLHIEGQDDPLVRANALAALCDPEGLLDDVRDVVVVSASAHRLTVRDVERAMAMPRPAYAPEPEAIQRQLADLAKRHDPQLLALRASAACVQWLQDWAHAHLGDDAPSLQALQKLLHPLQGHVDAVQTPPPKVFAEEVVAHLEPSELAPVSANTPALAVHPSPQHSREQVRQTLAQVRAWIEQHEPSSPVAILLKQAERMWGKRFSEVAGAIPADLLQKWDQDDQDQPNQP